MQKKLHLKNFKTRKKASVNNRIFVVAYARNRLNGRYLKKLGWYQKHKNGYMCFFDKQLLGYWLNKGLIIKPRNRLIWAMSYTAHANRLIKEKNNNLKSFKLKELLNRIKLRKRIY